MCVDDMLGFDFGVVSMPLHLSYTFHQYIYASCFPRVQLYHFNNYYTIFPYQASSSSDKPTEIGFKRKRRAEVADGAATSSKSSRTEVMEAARRQGAASWTAGHTKEEEFQRAKVLARKLEGVGSGELLPSEINVELEALASERTARAASNRKTREAAEARLVQALGDGERAPPDFNGLKMFLDKCVVEAMSPTTMASVRDIARRHRMTIVTDRLTATLFLVADPAALGPLTALSVALRGGRVAELGFLLRGGRGASIVHKPALHMKRAVWVSPAFSASHPVFSDLVRNAVAGFGHACKWTLLGTRHDFVSLARKRTGMAVLALVTQAEHTRYQARSTLLLLPPPPVYINVLIGFRLKCLWGRSPVLNCTIIDW